MTPARSGSSEDLGWRDETRRRHSRRAREGRCPECGAEVVAGLDADALAFPALADPTPIGPGFELECQFAQRMTYDFHGGVLTRRSDSVLNHWSARRIVLAQHRCESPAPHREFDIEKTESGKI